MRNKLSPQANQVLGVLSERSCHLTAEEILGSLNGIGVATVYRALEHLTEMGLVRKLSVGKKSAVYEYIRKEHMHFVCRQCGGVYDIVADFSGMVEEAAKCCGHQVSWSEITVHGICQACQIQNRQDHAS